MKNVSFSVIMPVYNKGPHIQRSINSVLNQSFKNFELILIDDASTDNSLSEIKKFSDPRIRLHHRDKPGAGGYEARNLGIENAKSDWVAFLDADDEWMPDHLENVYRLRQSHQSVDFFCSGWLVKDANNEVENKFYEINKSGPSGIIIDLNRYLSIHSKGIDVVNTNVAVLRKSILKKIGGFPQPTESCKRAGDGQTWLRTMLSGAEMLWFPKVSSIYYQDTVNMVTKKKLYSVDENGLLSFLKNAIKSGEFDQESTALLKRYYKSRASSAFFQHVKRGDVNGGILMRSVSDCGVNLRTMMIVLGYFFPVTIKKIVLMKS